MHTKFSLESLKVRNHLKDVDIDRRIILKWILRKHKVDWIDLAQDRDWWGGVLQTW
jgi:hypothetical protein